MGFPRISASGALILAMYLKAITYFFNNSMYGDSFRSGAMLSSSIPLNSFVMASSLLNVISHSAVVLGALTDTYVLSILVGVGFDVMTRILHLIWWIHLTRISFQDRSMNNRLKEDSNTVGFIIILTIIYIYHMIIHVRALRLNHSRERLKLVLVGALNNLRGVSGEVFQDHIFAYSDLGGHILPLGLSTILLKRQYALLTSFQALTVMILFSFSALSRIPLKDIDDGKPLLSINNVGNITCSCNACTRRTARKSRESSFTFNTNDGICHLWLCSFEKLSTFLGSTVNKME